MAVHMTTRFLQNRHINRFTEFLRELIELFSNRNKNAMFVSYQENSYTLGILLKR